MMVLVLLILVLLVERHGRRLQYRHWQGEHRGIWVNREIAGRQWGLVVLMLMLLSCQIVVAIRVTWTYCLRSITMLEGSGCLCLSLACFDSLTPRVERMGVVAA